MSVSAKIMKFSEKLFHHPETGAAYDETYLPQDGPDWLNEFRQRSLRLFRAEGLPTSKLERFKYTNLASKLKSFGPSLSSTDLVLSGHVDFVSRIMESLDQDWVRHSLTEMPPGAARFQDMALWYLNNAYMRDGLVIDIPAGARIETPLHIHITGHAGFFAPRTFFNAGENSDFTIIEQHDGEGHYWNNRVTQIRVGKNATLRHYRIQDYDARAIYTQNTHVTIEEGGIYEAFTLTQGAQVSRNQIHAEIRGEKAACNLYGLNLLSGRQQGDSTYLIEHTAPNCTSDQSVRSLLDGYAQGVFQGKVHVHRVAQKTDAYQLSNTLLLSDHASMNTKPELEIYADDVKCSHGATTGQLEEEPLFYLRSRGLTESEARLLLINAFVGEIIDKLQDADFAATIRERAERWLLNAL